MRPAARLDEHADAVQQPGQPEVSGYWIEKHAMAAAVAWPAVIMAVFVPLAVRQYQRLSA